MEKLYEEIVFVNDSAPALNASNLNAMSHAIDELDNRVIEGYPDASVVRAIQAEVEKSAQDVEKNVSVVEGYAKAAAISAENALASAELAQTTVSDLSAQFQDAIDKIDAIVGGE